MLWADIAPVLKSVIESIALEASDPLWATQWAAQQAPFMSPTVQADIVLRIPISRALYDEKRSTFDAVAQTVTRTNHGVREFTLNVQARSWDHSYATWALEYCERVRTRITRDVPRAALLAANVVLVERGNIQEVSATVDGRELSAANLDLFMRAGFEDSETGLGWIETIELTTHVKNAAGVELSAPPNLQAVTLP
jgi:hypothetical protein